MNITVKEKAMKMLLERNKGTEKFLRVTVGAGGCAGMTYHAEIGGELKEGEEVVFQSGDVRVVSDQQSVRYLDGLVIDYSDDLISGGLRFTNEKTKNTCGCGSSFSLAGFPVKQNGTCSK